MSCNYRSHQGGVQLENTNIYYPKLYSWLAGIPVSEIDKLVIRQFEAGEMIIYKNHLFKYVSIVLDGICNVINQLDNGTEVITLRLSRGNLIGVSESVLGSMRNIASIKACTRIVTAELDLQTFWHWLDSYPCFARFVLKDLVTRLHYTADFSANCQSSASKINLAKYFMDRYNSEASSAPPDSKISVKIQKTHEIISNFLGVNTRTVERHIHALKKDGLISTSKGKVYISSSQYQELLHYVTSNL